MTETVSKSDIKAVWKEMREFRRDLKDTREHLIEVRTRLSDFKVPAQPCIDMQRILRERDLEKQAKINTKWQTMGLIVGRIVTSLLVGIGCAKYILWKLG